MATKAQDSSFFVINNLKGGMNDTDPPQAVADDCCVLAKNVEFLASTMGERRLGAEVVDVSTSLIALEDRIVFLAVHLPELTEIKNSLLFAVGATPDLSTRVALRNGVALTDINPVDPILPTSPEIYQIRAQSSHNKLFVTYKSAEDRTHVLDGIILRRAGLAAPASAPTAGNSGVGAFSGARTYRVRLIKKTGAVINLRSEPSPELVFTPSGGGLGVAVARPASVGEVETHWELEASSGDGNFYVIATTPIATTSFVDTNTTVQYADFVLSEAIGAYSLIESAKFVIADQDRLIFGGSWEDPTHGSRIAWTPVYTATGVGNDERMPSNTTNFRDLDWQDAGELTGMSKPINGSFYVFKLSRIYKIQRTGELANAYDDYLLSTTRGAIPGSVVDGTDEAGRPCVYFLDPAVGPCRVSQAGIQFMSGIRGTWETVNTTADKLVTHGIYYPDKFQVHWWVATDNANSPNYKIIAQITEVQSTDTGNTIRGWSVADGTIAMAYCSTILPETATDPVTGITSLHYRPYAGFDSPHLILRCDIGNNDNGDTYVGLIRTKPYILAGLLNRFGVMAGALFAKTLDDPEVMMQITVIRDFGVDTNSVETDFLSNDDGDAVNKRFDDLIMSNAYAIQFEFADPDIIIA